MCRILLKTISLVELGVLFLFALKRKMYAYSMENKQFGENNNNSYNEWSAGNSQYFAGLLFIKQFFS